jgi:hypothetical protein
MSLPYPAAPAQSESRSVLAIPAFRKLWQAMAFSSFGDWLGLLASTALAQQLAGGDYAKANFAIAGVFIEILFIPVYSNSWKLLLVVYRIYFGGDCYLILVACKRSICSKSCS